MNKDELRRLMRGDNDPLVIANEKIAKCRAAINKLGSALHDMKQQFYGRGEQIHTDQQVHDAAIAALQAGANALKEIDT